MPLAVAILAKVTFKSFVKGLLPSYRTSQLFVQDNARIYTSRVVRTFLADHQITTLDWPAYSPDLNPIEHL